MTKHPLTHRGITIVESDHPSGARTWAHEETGSGGIAHTHEEAIRQISRFLGPDPDCTMCRGKGTHTRHWPIPLRGDPNPDEPCRACFPEDRVDEEHRRVG